MPLATLTHARLRARQGDVEGARRLVGEILQRDPDDRAALRLLEQLRQGGGPGQPVVEAEPQLAEPEPAQSGDIAERFRRELGRSPRRERIRRLEAWLARVAGGAR